MCCHESPSWARRRGVWPWLHPPRLVGECEAHARSREHCGGGRPVLGIPIFRPSRLRSSRKLAWGGAPGEGGNLTERFALITRRGIQGPRGANRVKVPLNISDNF